MIKINLLPPWIHEPRRILVLSIISLVIGGMGAGFMVMVKNDMLGPIDKYYTEKSAFEKVTQECEAQKSIATQWEGDSKKYDDYVKFFSGEGLKTYNDSIAQVLEEVSTKVGTFPGAYYQTVTISDKSVTLNGKIKGLMNFVSYYFQMKNQGMALTPNAKPYSTSLDQEIALETKGTLTKAPIAAPVPPTSTPVSPYGDLYKNSAAVAPPVPGAAPAK